MRIIGSLAWSHPPLAVLSLPETLEGFLVLEVDQSHGDGRVPAAFIGAAEIYLLVVHGDNGEVDVFARPLHTIQLLYGLELELLALAPLLAVGEHVKALFGQDAELFPPELEEVVAPFLQLAFHDHIGDLHFHSLLGCCLRAIAWALVHCWYWELGGLERSWGQSASLGSLS